MSDSNKNTSAKSIDTKDKIEIKTAETKAVETEPIVEKDTVLVAEDSATNRKILVHVLKKLGYEVIECEDGRVAINILKSQTVKNLVLVISDVMMPNQDGLEVLKFIRESASLKDLPVILATAVTDREFIMRAKALRVNSYIVKPLTFQRVAEKLQELFPDKKFPKLVA
ncbi:MAG: response regulator [Deltaproteobacteria bacterium]|nr:response regulator [Deltaproteobacteria bacterium]